jgi:class 3 adenylate cyclase
VGQFAGDGIMAYFNDPLPTDDPARAAVDMALALQPAIRDLVTSWRRRGYDLGYGMGIALGHATLGTIGFESRYDYTPVGSVVNLASRLCSEAQHDQILIDHRTRTQIDGAAVAEPILLRLKGFDQDVHAFSLTAPATAGTNS